MLVHVDITGRTGLVMHNIRLADKLDPYAKQIAEITAKRKKTEADNADVAKLEWFGGLYHDPEVGVYVPPFNVVRCLEEAAKVTKQGKTLIRAFAFGTDKLPLVYEGPASPEALWKRPEHRWRTSVGIQGRAVITRMRPIFQQWSLAITGDLLEDVMDPGAFERIVELAGRAEGLGDARKLGYGRFTAVVSYA